MKGFSADIFLEKYIKSKKNKATGMVTDKIVDQFQTGNRKLIPFTTNPNSGSLYNGKCGFNGVAGEFYRIKMKSSVTPIYTPQDAYEILSKGLREKFKMSDDEATRFINIFNDVMFENETLNVIDPTFFAYVPLKYNDKEHKKDKRYDKYRCGQQKMAEYCVSIAEGLLGDYSPESKERNLFCEVIHDCLEKQSFEKSAKYDKYFVLPFIKEQFAMDFQWLMSKNESIAVGYFPLMLYFYLSYSIVQTLAFMNQQNKNSTTDKPCLFTFMLSSEKASAGHPAVKKGWAASDHFPDTFLNKMFAYSQALDILNSMFEEEDEFLTYQEVYHRFSEMEFDSEARIACELVLDTYQDLKRNLLSERSTEKEELPEPIDVQVNGYEDFASKLLKLCIDLQSKEYPRMKTALYSLLEIKIFERRREYRVLALDDDLLLFLIAMITKGERVRLEDLFHQFHNYGIEFSYKTQNVISEFLMKLNLLDRKSDSGEAQYVRVVL